MFKQSSANWQAISREPKDEQEVLIEAAAEVTGAWATADPGVLDALDKFHVWTPEYLQTRCNEILWDARGLLGGHVWRRLSGCMVVECEGAVQL